MTIKWRDEMSVGCDSIDNDHKNLINLIIEYEKTLELKSVKRLNLVFSELVRYSEEHFKREEDLLFKSQYPLALDHSEHHEVLLTQLKDFHKLLTEKKKFNAQKTSDFFRTWLIEHVLQEDLKFKTYIEKKIQ